MSDSQPSIEERLLANDAALGALGDTLLEDEVYWRDRYQLLASRGYKLRPRYHPQWVPSWQGKPGVDPFDCEDYFQSSNPHLIDATQEADGRLVYIKRVPSDSEELKIATFFSQTHLRSDPRNHCIPILDTFPDDRVENISYMVMPFLRPMDDPPFEFVGEVVEFADQVVEGLAFMHENFVAHRDCAPSNLFMDADPLYPRGFHPLHPDKSRDMTTRASYIPRSSVSRPIRYYFADFDLSVKIPAGMPRSVLGRNGADREVPELSARVPYDPFKTDIFILGNALRRQLHDKYFRVEFLRPLILSMTKKNPDDRPSAEGALRQWQSIRKHITAFQRVCRLRGRDEGIVTSLISDVLSLFKVSFIIAGRLLRWTSDWIALILA